MATHAPQARWAILQQFWPRHVGGIASAQRPGYEDPASPCTQPQRAIETLRALIAKGALLQVVARDYCSRRQGAVQASGAVRQHCRNLWRTTHRNCTLTVAIFS